MAHILHSELTPVVSEVEEPDGQGGTRKVEKTVNRVKSVTFHIDPSTVHTLTFHDKGHKLVDGEGRERVVGEGDVVYYEFETPEEAVQAYFDGKVR